MPREDLEDIDDLKVIAFPTTYVQQRLNKGFKYSIYGVSIVVMKKINPRDLTTDTDDLLLLTKEICDNLYQINFPINKMDSYDLINAPVFDYEKMSSNSMFQSIIGITLKVTDEAKVS